jgi:hypothetical protein
VQGSLGHSSKSVATSSGQPPAFWRSPVGRWLGSSKNILGSVLAGGALVAQVFVGLGMWWPGVVVASYVIGALLAPRDRVHLGLDFTGTMTTEDMQQALAELRRQLKPNLGRLPQDASDLVATILDHLTEIVSRWDALSTAADQAHTVQSMIGDYLPTSIQGYVNLPRTFAVSSRVEGKNTAHDELVQQLTILSTESEKIRTAVYSKDLDALRDQGRFLRDKFGKSDLDLQ